MRIDLRMVELGLAPTRSKAQQMIRAGEVEVSHGGQWHKVTRASAPGTDVRVIEGGDTLRYVSRGGLKLEHALRRTEIDVRGARVLDIGQSTGGFTDCVLQLGAAQVFGIDVGHDQLHPVLRDDRRVITIEGINARALDLSPETRAWVHDGVSLVVLDLSFISIITVIPALARLLPETTAGLFLIKPQFEVGQGKADGRGVVTDVVARAGVRLRIERALIDNDFDIVDYFACGLRGQDGNQEYFARVRRR